MSIGSQIKEARKRKKISQKELAEKIGKGFSTVQKYEMDIIIPPIDVLKKIGEVLSFDFSLNTKYSEEFCKRVGEQIHQARVSANMSQQELAECLEESIETIRSYELGYALPSWPTIISIAGALHINPSRISGAISTDDPDVLEQDGEALMYEHDRNAPKKDIFMLYFRKLNETGQDRAIEYAFMLSQQDRFRKVPRNHPKED